MAVTEQDLFYCHWARPVLLLSCFFILQLLSCSFLEGPLTPLHFLPKIAAAFEKAERIRARFFSMLPCTDVFIFPVPSTMIELGGSGLQVHRNKHKVVTIGSSFWTGGRTSSLWGWQSPGTGCPGRLWSLLLWRYSRPAWTRSCAAYCRWPCFGRGVGLDDPQRSLPAPTILWFCDSVNSSPAADGWVCAVSWSGYSNSFAQMLSICISNGFTGQHCNALKTLRTGFISASLKLGKAWPGVLFELELSRTNKPGVSESDV